MWKELTQVPSGLVRSIARVRQERQRVRTEIALGTLPEYIRKDIGWPDNFAGQRLRGGM